jgi:hypothetical protein
MSLWNFSLCHHRDVSDVNDQWHRWNSNIIYFLGEYEAICETALSRESGPQVGLIDEKIRGSKISCNCPFKKHYRDIGIFLFLQSPSKLIR